MTLFECYKKCCSCLHLLDRPSYGNCEKNCKDIIDLTSDQITFCKYYVNAEKLKEKSLGKK